MIRCRRCGNPYKPGIAGEPECWACCYPNTKRDRDTLLGFISEACEWAADRRRARKRASACH